MIHKKIKMLGIINYATLQAISLSGYLISNIDRGVPKIVLSMYCI
jgi:hypothetical protein